VVIVVGVLEEVTLEFNSSVVGSEKAGIVIVFVVVVGAPVAVVGVVNR